jgi:hypothetical protein
MDLSTFMSDRPAALSRWHAVVESKDPALLDDLLADEVVFQGADFLRWNAEGKLVSFTVMVRPLRGLQELVELMAIQLTAGQA